MYIKFCNIFYNIILSKRRKKNETFTEIFFFMKGLEKKMVLVYKTHHAFTHANEISKNKKSGAY